MADLIGKQLGQYEIVALLGEGGMAKVYRARQGSIQRDVAVKVIESRLAQMGDFVKRFEREARTIASLSHPHILKVFDYGQYEDLVYLVMELLAGGSLAELIRAGSLPLATVSKILDQIAPALDYAHRRGIIHRDLKPQNVLLDENGNAFLTDFGIAKLVGSMTVLTQTGSAMGTPAYMAPEQWRGEPVDSRTDIYALGVMLFQMLSSQLPFSGTTPATLMHMHVFEPPPPLRTIRPDLPKGVEQVLGRALAKDREQRYPVASELAADYKAALSGAALPDATLPEVIVAASPADKATILESPALPMAKPTTPGRQLATALSASRRNRLPVILGIALAGVLGVIGLIALVLTNGPGAVTPTALPSAQVVIVSEVSATPTGAATVTLAAAATTAPAIAAQATENPPTATQTATVIPSSTSRPSVTASVVPPTTTPTAAPTEKPGIETQAAGIFDRRASLTANAEASLARTPIPDEAQTLAAVGATDTPGAVSQPTQAPTRARVPTRTLRPTDEPQPIPPSATESVIPALDGVVLEITPQGALTEARDAPSIAAGRLRVLFWGDRVLWRNVRLTAEGRSWLEVILGDGRKAYILDRPNAVVERDPGQITDGISVGTSIRVAAGGDGMHLRETTSTSAAEVMTLHDGDTLTVIDGPQYAEYYLWWQLQAPDGTTGWAVDVPSWWISVQ